MGHSGPEAPQIQQNEKLQLRYLFNTALDTHEILKAIRDEQERAVEITRQTTIIHHHLAQLINGLGKRSGLLGKPTRFTKPIAQEMAGYYIKLKDLRLSIDHLQRSVPLIVEKIVAKIVGFHHDINDALLKDMEQSLVELLENAPNSSKILQLQTMISNQALASRNDEIFSRLSEIIEGLKIVNASINDQLVPYVIPFLDQNRDTLAKWLSAYHDPLFQELFGNYPAHLVMNTYELTREGLLPYSRDAIKNYIDTHIKFETKRPL